MKKLLAIMLALIMALAMVPALAEGKEQIYWAVVDTDSDGTADKLVISPAAQAGTCFANGSFDYDEIFDVNYDNKPSPIDHDVPWKSYLGNITSAVVEATVKPVSTSHWFNKMNQLTSVDLSGLSGERLTDMHVMFCECNNLPKIEFPNNLDTSKVTNMRYMFGYCTQLTALDLSMFNTSSVTNMAHMFRMCKKLNSLNLSSFNTSKVQTMEHMFDQCESLKTLDLSSFDLSGLINDQMIAWKQHKGTDCMFQGCEFDSLVLDTSTLPETVDKIKYKANGLKVSLNPNGGTLPDNQLIVDAGALPTPTRLGYQFDGWYYRKNYRDTKLEQDTDGNYIGTAGTSYWAEWTELIGITVTFDAQGGTVTPEKMFYENGKVNELPIPTRGGYDFVGWFTAATGGIQVNVGYEIPMFIQTDADEKVPVKEVTLYAQWKAKQPEQQPSGGGHSHYYPTTTPVPVIVIPPQTGDMTVWQSILHFLGIR